MANFPWNLSEKKLLSDLEISLQITATRENDNNNQVSARSVQFDSIYLHLRDTILSPETVLIKRKKINGIIAQNEFQID